VRDHKKVITKCLSLGKLKVYDLHSPTPIITKYSKKSIRWFSTT